MSETSPVPHVDIDLDALRNTWGEWNYGPHHDYPRISEHPDATATRTPDVDGYTVWFRQRGWTRDQLPGLIAFLAATYGASAPEPVEEDR